MRTAEDVAREMAGAIYVAMHSDQTWAVMAWNDMGGSEPTEERALLELAALDLVRARDAEVRADERAKVMEGFGEEHAMFWAHDEGTGRLRRPGPGIPHRRIVGPWEPTP